MEKNTHGFETKVLRLASVGLVAIAVMTACGKDPFYNGYYKEIDSRHATAAVISEMATAAAAVPIPVITPRPQPEFQFANDSVECTSIDNSGTVSDAVLDANKGTLPAFILNGVEMQASLDHNGQRIIAPLQKIMSGENTSMDLAAPGDQVCISGNLQVLSQLPTPTPQS